MELNLVTLGSNIRKHRKLHHLTIEQLAEIADLSPSYLGLVERGQRKIAIDKLWHIADILDTNIGSLVKTDTMEANSCIDTLMPLLTGLSKSDCEYICDMVKLYRKHIRNL